jgi:hypothetical protein
MKKIPIYLRIPIFTFIVIYLLVSFIIGNINLMSWLIELRLAMVLVWGVFSALFIGIYYDK